MEVSAGAWTITIAAILALLIVDLVVTRNPHDVSVREATGWSVFYVAASLAFGMWVWWRWGADLGTQYLSAWLVEKSLSVDNLFVFAIILARFTVPSDLHQRVLLVGIVAALIMRAGFIALGAAALHSFSFTFVIFGALLIWTGVQLARHRDEDPEPADNLLVRAMRRRLPFTDAFHGSRAFIRVDGRRVATPLLLVMIAIGSTDLLFALDSIPATFGVTEEPFLVFAANAFALLGLRALYFLLKGLLDRLVYLSLGLAAILVFIGVKLMLTFAHEVDPAWPKIPTPIGLAVIAIILAVATVASLRRTAADPTANAHAGSLRSHHKEPESDVQTA